MNQERKSLVLTDHDPNAAHYSDLELAQLEQKLANLEVEEDEAVKALTKRFQEISRNYATAIQNYCKKK